MATTTKYTIALNGSAVLQVLDDGVVTTEYSYLDGMVTLSPLPQTERTVQELDLNSVRIEKWLGLLATDLGAQTTLHSEYKFVLQKNEQ